MNLKLALVVFITTLGMGCASSGILHKNEQPLFGHLAFHGEVQKVEQIQYDAAGLFDKYGRVVILLDRVDLWEDAESLSHTMWQGEQERTFIIADKFHARYPDVGDRVMFSMLLYQNYSYTELERLILHIIYTDGRIEYRPIIYTWYK